MMAKMWRHIMGNKGRARVGLVVFAGISALLYKGYRSAFAAKELLQKYKMEYKRENKEILLLSREYVKAGIIPKRFENDAVIIAAATFYGADVLVSWNFKHMVKFKTKRGANAINKLNGYGEIDIYSPWKVVENVED